MSDETPASAPEAQVNEEVIDPNTDRSIGVSNSSEEQDRPDALSHEDVLKLLRSDNGDRAEALRSGEIVDEWLNRLNGTEWQAENVTLFLGDVNVGGDFSSSEGRGSSSEGRGSGKRRPRQTGPSVIDCEHLADYTRNYVEPEGFADALWILSQENLVVLAAPGGTGRDAAGLSLLLRVLESDAMKGDVFELSPQVLGNSGWKVPRQRAGYVLSDSTSHRLGLSRPGRQAMTVELLDDAWLTRTSAVLKAAGSYLVVITESVRGKLATATRRDEFVVQHLDVPDPMEVVRGRVEASPVSRSWSEVEQELADADAYGLLAERPNPRFAVLLATKVIDGLALGLGLRTVVDQLRNAREQVAEWLGSDVTPKEIAFAFATAVLERSSYLTVADAAISLNRALSGSSGEISLRYLRALVADHTWFELVRDKAGGTTSAGRPEAVRFRSSRLQAAVLTQVWHELDGMRPKILVWLRGLAGHSDVEVRARAASAAGILATTDFQHALHRYLLPWAVGNSATERHSAALALGLVGSQASHTTRVWSIVRQWSDEVLIGNRRRLPEVAVSVAGGPMGVRDPGRALDLLRTVVDHGAWSLLEPVAVSALRLIDGERSAEVLSALLSWTEPRDRSDPVVKSLTIFAFVVLQAAYDIRGDGKSTWPTLLTTAHMHRDELPELWGRALHCEPVRSLAVDALRGWLRIVDEDWAAYPVVLDIFAGVADRSDEDSDRIEFHLERWAVDERDPSTAAAHIFDALADAGELP